MSLLRENPEILAAFVLIKADKERPCFAPMAVSSFLPSSLILKVHTEISVVPCGRVRLLAAMLIQPGNQLYAI